MSDRPQLNIQDQLTAFMVADMLSWLSIYHDAKIRYCIHMRSHIRCAARCCAVRLLLVTAALRCALLPVASANNVIGYSAL